MDFSVDETALGVSILKFIMDTTLFLFFFLEGEFYNSILVPRIFGFTNCIIILRQVEIQLKGLPPRDNNTT